MLNLLTMATEEMNRVTKAAKVRIGDKSLSNFMYAVILTRASIKKTFGVGIYTYTRSQNIGNMVDVLIEIDKREVETFNFLSGIILTDPITVRPA